MDRSRGYGYAASLQEYLQASPQAILGQLTEHASKRRWASTEHEQVAAWTQSMDWLTSAAKELRDRHAASSAWHLCLEYEIPRRGGRIDAVLLADELVFVLEFKANQADAAARRQAEDYGLELLDFHEESQGRSILPILVALDAPFTASSLEAPFGVAAVSLCWPTELASLVEHLWAEHHDDQRTGIVASEWLGASYHPTPTILEAASALYSGHSVRELSTSEASAEHLQRTFDGVARAVEDSAHGRKIIAFVTGTPGAGKTLAGLNVVHHLPEGNQAAFLSGNGPLVSVLQQVLARDLAQRSKCSKAEGLRTAKTLVTNVHRWIDEYIDRSPDQAPLENVVVFDEAQRAWDRKQSLRKFGRDSSEPEMMLSAMGRRDRAVIVGLIGGGQEINTGEAGLSEWGRALSERYTDWDIFVSPQLASGQPVAGTALFENESQVPKGRLRTDPALHLETSQRSFRTQHLTDWVEAVLAGEAAKASLLMEQLWQYPIVMTRELEVAKDWIRRQTRGLRRCGLLASSGARRLRPYGISVQERIKETDWFLAPPDDVSLIELPRARHLRVWDSGARSRLGLLGLGRRSDAEWWRMESPCVSRDEVGRSALRGQTSVRHQPLPGAPNTSA